MATIARTEDMFMRTTGAQAGAHAQNRLDALVRFVSRVLTPDWVLAWADELAEQRDRHQPE